MRRREAWARLNLLFADLTLRGARDHEDAAWSAATTEDFLPATEATRHRIQAEHQRARVERHLAARGPTTNPPEEDPPCGP